MLMPHVQRHERANDARYADTMRLLYALFEAR